MLQPHQIMAVLILPGWGTVARGSHPTWVLSLAPSFLSKLEPLAFQRVSHVPMDLTGRGGPVGKCGRTSADESVEGCSSGHSAAQPTRWRFTDPSPTGLPEAPPPAVYLEAGDTQGWPVPKGAAPPTGTSLSAGATCPPTSRPLQAGLPSRQRPC